MPAKSLILWYGVECACLCCVSCRLRQDIFLCLEDEMKLKAQLMDEQGLSRALMRISHERRIFWLAYLLR